MATTVCPGCVGRGTGPTCVMCGQPIPTGLRRRNGDPSEYRPDCDSCARGTAHTHR